MDLNIENTILAVVDMQERFAPAIHNFDAVQKRIVQLCSAANAMDLSVIVTEQYPKGLGHTVEPIRQVLREGVPVIEKTAFSCFGSEDFRKELIGLKKKTVLLCGIESHICLLQTALDAADRGYETIVIADAVSSRHPEDRETALNFLRAKDISVLSMDSVLFLLLKDSAHPAFRAVQKIIV